MAVSKVRVTERSTSPSSLSSEPSYEAPRAQTLRLMSGALRCAAMMSKTCRQGWRRFHGLDDASRSVENWPMLFAQTELRSWCSGSLGPNRFEPLFVGQTAMSSSATSKLFEQVLPCGLDPKPSRSLISQGVERADGLGGHSKDLCRC